MAKPRLFVDADGTLAQWRNISIPLTELDDAESAAKKLFDILQTPGYFYSLNPNENVVQAVRRLVQSGNVEVFVCTCYPPDGEHSSPKAEKNAWFDKYISEIDESHRIFVPYGECKADYIPGGVKENDYLLDDKTTNLEEFKAAGGKGIKLLNGVNHSNGTWKSSRLSYANPPEHIAFMLELVVCKQVQRYESKPTPVTEIFDYESFPFESYAREVYNQNTKEM